MRNDVKNKSNAKRKRRRLFQAFPQTCCRIQCGGFSRHDLLRPMCQKQPPVGKFSLRVNRFIFTVSTDKLLRETIAPPATALDSFGIRQSKLRHGKRHAKSLYAGENASRRSNILDEHLAATDEKPSRADHIGRIDIGWITSTHRLCG